MRIFIKIKIKRKIFRVYPFWMTRETVKSRFHFLRSFLIDYRISFTAKFERKFLVFGRNGACSWKASVNISSSKRFQFDRSKLLVTSPLLPFLKGNGGKFTPLQSPFNILRRPSLDVVPRKRVEKYN